MEDRPISLSVGIASVPENKRARDATVSRFPVIQSPCLLARLAVVPVQEKERKRAHNQEKQDPHPEAGIVFNGLVKKEETKEVVCVGSQIIQVTVCGRKPTSRMSSLPSLTFSVAPTTS